MLKLRSCHLALLAALPLLGCAQASRPEDAEPQQRVIVTTVHDWPSAADVALRARRLAGVPVRDALDIGALRYRMTLVCPDNDACRAAMARIAADRSFALGVEADGRMQIPAKPTREQSR
jgi:hypothetical protein